MVFIIIVMYFGNITYLLAQINHFCLSHQLSGMPCEFVTNFDAKYPVILGGLLSSEDTMGFLQVSFCSFHVSFCDVFSSLTCQPCLLKKLCINFFFFNCYVDFLGALKKASLAQAHSQDTGPADHVCWLAQVSDASNVLGPGPQRPASTAEVHPRTLALYGYLIW